MRAFIVSSLVALAWLHVGACAPEDPTPTHGRGRLVVTVDGRVVSAGETIPLAAAGLAVGATAVAGTLTVANAGDGDLDVTDVRVRPSPEGAIVLSAEAATIVPPTSFELPIATSRTFHFYVTRPDGMAIADVELVRAGRVSFAFRVEVTAPGAPRLSVSPSSHDWGPWFAEGTLTKPVELENKGDVDLRVTAPRIVGDQAFGLDAPELAAFDPALILAPGARHTLAVRYTAVEPIRSASATLVIPSNDPSRPSGAEVALAANAGGDACIEVGPQGVDPTRTPGAGLAPIPTTFTIRSCGALPLRVSAVAIEPAGAAWSVAPGVIPELVNGAEHGLTVTFTPTPSLVEAHADATLVITSNGGERRLPLEGPLVCPTPIIDGVPEAPVAPQTVLSLAAGRSTAWTGTIAAWAWSVVQPDGSASTFRPSASAADPSFELNVAGTYTVSLAVTDSHGRPSCAPATATVEVIAGEGVHLELVWSTPGDADETDSGEGRGADMDLHLLHPAGAGGYTRDYDGDGDGAPDGWFDDRLDCYWLELQRDWGPLGASGDAVLERDDVDGAGPENLRVPDPEDVTYDIAVHAWDDHGFGPSLPRVRVYLDGDLVAETSVPPSLVEGDMWVVGEISPATREVTWLVDCGEAAPQRCARDDIPCLAACEWLVVEDYALPAHVGTPF